MRRRTFFSAAAAVATCLSAGSASGDIPRGTITGEYPRFPVRINGKTGYINERGKLVIPADYAWGGAFSEGIALVFGGDRIGWYIDPDGEKLFESPFTHDHKPFFGGFAQGSIGLEFRFIDRRGKLLPQVFAGSHAFAEGMAAVCINPARFVPRQPGHEFRWEPGKWGFINSTGELRVPAEYWGVGDFSGGLAPVYVGGQSHMCTGLAGGAWGYVNKRGTIVIAPQFQSASSFSEGLAAVAWRDFGTGYINLRGEFAIEPGKFSAAFSFHDGVAIIRGRSDHRNPGWNDFGYVDKLGNIFTHENFRFGLSEFSEGLGACREKPTWNGTEWIQGPYGYVNKRAEWIVKPQFTHAEKFTHGLAQVSSEGAMGYIDKTGQFVRPLTK